MACMPSLFLSRTRRCVISAASVLASEIECQNVQILPNSLHIVHPIHALGDLVELLLRRAQHPNLVVTSCADVLNDGLEVQQNVFVGANILGDLIDQKQQLEVVFLG